MENPVKAYLDAHPGETWYSLARQCGLAPMTMHKLLVSQRTRFITPGTMQKLYVGTLGEITIESLEAWNRANAA